MPRQSFYRRLVFPMLLVIVVMVVSSYAYDLSRGMEHRWIVAQVSALFMFLSIWAGALFSNTIAYFRGASFRERLIVCLVPAVLWSAKVLSSFWGIFSFSEFMFLWLHNIILGCPVVALLCLGLSEFWCRALHRRRVDGGRVRILVSPGTAAFLIGLALTFAMLYNGGHTYYYLYMDLYTKLFL